MTFYLCLFVLYLFHDDISQCPSGWCFFGHEHFKRFLFIFINFLLHDNNITSINLSELTSHVNTINLQIEVTNFIHKCCLEGGNVSGLRASSDGEKLPTLFGNGHAKAELAIQVSQLEKTGCILRLGRQIRSSTQ